MIEDGKLVSTYDREVKRFMWGCGTVIGLIGLIGGLVWMLN